MTKLLEILTFVTFLMLKKSHPSPIPQDYMVQYYDPYYQHYQWPYQYHQSDTDVAQNVVPYQVQSNYDYNGYNYNQNSVADDDSKNIFGNIFESFFRPTTTPKTSTVPTTPRTTTTTKSPQTTTSLAESLVQRDCVEKCIERPPSQYDPVCGSNNETYYNDGRLYCAADCGVDVTLVRRGTCTPMLTMIVSGMTNSVANGTLI
ncbi:hypothetical protein ACKWTF_013972 [Chironomus riparius]